MGEKIWYFLGGFYFFLNWYLHQYQCFEIKQSDFGTNHENNFGNKIKFKLSKHPDSNTKTIENNPDQGRGDRERERKRKREERDRAWQFCKGRPPLAMPNGTNIPVSHIILYELSDCILYRQTNGTLWINFSMFFFGKLALKKALFWGSHTKICCPPP